MFVCFVRCRRLTPRAIKMRSEIFIRGFKLSLAYDCGHEMRMNVEWGDAMAKQQTKKKKTHHQIEEEEVNTSRKFFAQTEKL